MKQQDTEAHIVNTASLGGLTSYSGVYVASKHAVVGLSEALHHELVAAQSKIKVSVLCPGAVDTDLFANSRKVQTISGLEANEEGGAAEAWQFRERALKQGMAPAEVAGKVFDGLRNDTFCIITSPERSYLVEQRVESLLRGDAPESALPRLLARLDIS